MESEVCEWARPEAIGNQRRGVVELGVARTDFHPSAASNMLMCVSCVTVYAMETNEKKVGGTCAALHR